MKGKKEITAEVENVPAAVRDHKIKELFEYSVIPPVREKYVEQSGGRLAPPMLRLHAVCIVQTFRNPQTGPMLYLFVQHWYRMGWKVIVYDRFGL